MLLYSIPSWRSFSDAFEDNPALIQRTRPTGFPGVPPAPRIVLDERESTDEEKKKFCAELALHLNILFETAYPGLLNNKNTLTGAAMKVAVEVLEHEITSTYRRLFVQCYLAALFFVLDGGELDDDTVKSIVGDHNVQLSKQG